MLLYIPGLPKESPYYQPCNVIFQLILFLTGYELIMFSDVIIMITIICCQAELEAITELFSMLNVETIEANKAGLIIKTAHYHHRILADQANKLTIAFWHIFLQKLMTIMLYLCTMLLTFQAVNEIPIAALLSIIVMMSEGFILCYFGQILRDSSERMAQAIYMTKWYEMKIRDQKDMLMLMMRFSYPVKVETFGFGTVSLFTFLQVF